MLSATATPQISTPTMLPTAPHNIKGAERKETLSNLQTIKNADSDITLEKQKKTARNTLVSFLSSIKRISIRCFRAIIPGDRDAYTKSDKKYTSDANKNIDISTDCCRSLQTDAVSPTKPPATEIIAKEYTPKKIEEATKIHHEALQFLKNNHEFIDPNGSLGKELNQTIERLKTVIDSLKEKHKNNDNQQNSTPRFIHNSDAKLNEVNQNNHSKKLKAIRDDISSIEKKMQGFASKYGDHIDKDLNDLFNDPEFQSSRKEARKLSNNLVDKQENYSTVSHLEKEYNSKLNSITNKALDIHNEMMAFARKNANFIDSKSNKGYYFEENLRRVELALDDLQEEYRDAEIKDAKHNRINARIMIEKYYNELDQLTENNR